MATINGREVVWGIPSGTKDAVHEVTGSGIVQSVSVADGIQELEILDEDSNWCTHVSYGEKSDLTIEVICEPDTVRPAAGDVLGDLSALELTGGAVIVKNSSVVFSNADVKKISIAATYYPDMVIAEPS